eukprot:5574262-Pyramimonas_sp.AAC.1
MACRLSCVLKRRAYAIPSNNRVTARPVCSFRLRSDGLSANVSGVESFAELSASFESLVGFACRGRRGNDATHLLV